MKLRDRFSALRVNQWWYWKCSIP